MKRILIGLVGYLFLVTYAFGQPIESDSVLRGDKPFGEASPAGDAFGSSLAEWKNWVFVGAVREASDRVDPTFNSPLEDGAIYVYERNKSGKLILRQAIKGRQDSAFLGDRFGAGVIASAGYLFVVSANGGDFAGLTDPAPVFGVPFAFAGAVEVYKLNRQTRQWVWQQQLISPLPRTGGSFGGRTQSAHLAISPQGDMLVITEPQLFPGAEPQMHVFTNGRNNQQFELRQSITLDSSDASSRVLAGDSVVAVGARHFAIPINRVNLDETGAPLSASNSIQVFRRKGRLLDIEPAQIIEGETIGAFDCDQTSNDITGMASAGGRLAFAQPCALGGTGKVDIYRVGRSSVKPYQLEASISGDVPGGRFGASLFGGQESLAFDHQGQRLIIGTSGSVSDPGGPGSRNSASVWQKTYRGIWEKTADLAPTSPDAIFGGFGSQVLFVGRNQALSATSDGDIDDLSGTGEVGVYELQRKLSGKKKR